MSISRYMAIVVVRCARALVLAHASGELAEAEMTVGHESAHAKLPGQRDRLPIAGARG